MSGLKVELYREIRPKVIEKVIFVTEVSVELFMWAKGGSLFVQGGTLTNNPDEREEQIYADGKVTGWENKKSKKKEPKQKSVRDN